MGLLVGMVPTVLPGRRDDVGDECPDVASCPPTPQYGAGVEHDDTQHLDLARAAAAAPHLSSRTGQPASRVLAALIGGRPLDNPVGCATGALDELARAASEPAHLEGDPEARAATTAALLRTYGLQAYLDRVRLRQVLQVDRESRQLSIPVHGGSARLSDGDDTTTHDVPIDQPWPPWEVARLVGDLLDHPVEPVPPVEATPAELPQLADDLSLVMGAGATFSTPEAAATVTAIADAVVRLARAARPGG